MKLNRNNIFSYILFPLMIINSMHLFAKELKYPVSEIPDSLKINAVAVIRNFETRVIVNSPESMSEKVILVVTVLNKNGDEQSLLKLPYNLQIKVTATKGIIYNAEGNVIKSFNQSDFYDYSPYENSLYSDNRVKSYRCIVNQYPYTVEYQYEYNFKGFLSLPHWYPITDFNVSVQASSYSIITPKDYTINYKQYNYTDIPDTSCIDPSKKSYYWIISNRKPIEEEPYMPSLSKVVPYIIAVPETFSYAGYYGKNTSWLLFGKWFAGLKANRDILPEETVNAVKVLTRSLNDTIEKVRAIYSYLQSKTRYYNISLGLGGYQPFTAADVDNYGYGDCKGLSNYASALLKAIGIPSYYTLASIDGKIDTSLVFQQFDHAILCVPLQSDTLWLECTSQICPFNYLGGDQDGKYVLLIGEDGGKLVKAPSFIREQNMQHRTAKVIILPDGNATSVVKTNYYGLQYENLFGFNQKTIDEQKKYLYEKYIDIPSFEIKQFSYNEDKINDPSATLNLDLTLNSYASVNSKRLFIPLNLMNKWGVVKQMRKARTYPIVRNMAFYDADTIYYSVPSGYSVEYLPSDTELYTPYGEYKTEVSFSNNTLTYIRTLKLNAGTFPAENWDEYSGFLKSIQSADNVKAVLVKN